MKMSECGKVLVSGKNQENNFVVVVTAGVLERYVRRLVFFRFGINHRFRGRMWSRKIAKIL